MRKIGILLLVISMVLANFVPVVAAENPTVFVTVDGKVLTFDVPPAVVNGRTLVPMRAIFEALDVSVEWDGVNKIITGRRGNTVIVLPLESRMATKNDQAIMLDVPATVIDGRTLVPVRFIAESLGAKVSWDSGSSTVVITSGSATDVEEKVVQEKPQQPSGKLTTAEIAEKANAVVTIINYGYEEDSFGSGFFISADGKIVTNYHVIENAMSLEVEFEDDTKYTGRVKVLGYDKEKDLAVLKIDGNNYPYLEMGDSSVEKIGTDVVAIGSPKGLKNTVSTGIISGFREGGTIQISAPVTSGSSGGPVLNYYGKVIAVTTSAYLMGGNLGFAVPINEVKALDVSKNLTLQEVYELEYVPMDGSLSYDEYVEYLYETAGGFGLNNRTYQIGFDMIMLMESTDDPDNLLLYYFLDPDNMQEFTRAYEAGYKDGIEELFSEVAVGVEEYYQKNVSAYIIYFDVDLETYPEQFVENEIFPTNTVRYDPETGKWDVLFPYLHIETNYGRDYYSAYWFE